MHAALTMLMLALFYTGDVGVPLVLVGCYLAWAAALVHGRKTPPTASTSS